MKSVVLISVILALFALVFPIALSVGNPLTDAKSELSDRADTEATNIEADSVETIADRDKNISIRLERDGEITELTMDNYLIGVVGAEMPATFDIEALKAQAVAARTYTLYKMLVAPSTSHPNADTCDDSTCCNAYKDDEQLREKWGESYLSNYEKIREAVSATDGQYLSYEDQPILAVFHSSSSGKTEASENAWGKALPYLVSVDSMEDTDNVPQYESIVTVSKSNFSETVKRTFPNAVFSDNANEWIQNIQYSDSNRLLSADIGGATVTGAELRRMFELRSTAVTINITDDSVVFTVTGYGHGVGLSQYGANAMAKSGKCYEEILNWYYTGTILKDMSE